MPASTGRRKHRKSERTRGKQHGKESDHRLLPQGTKAPDCIRCGKCERVCPQHLPVRELLMQVADMFEG
ncbi:MAG: 4Fe-4S dicluster domain-containing protein [Oscillospiraceae bacterium]|nr:4Fe-4S dicluster domain-containing protein [Oscillospiraceae bacterium]